MGDRGEQDGRVTERVEATETVASVKCLCGWPEADCIIRASGSKPEENLHLSCAERDQDAARRALDTDEPQGSPPTSSSKESGEGGGAGAGLDLDRLAAAIRFALQMIPVARVGPRYAGKAADAWTALDALLERVRVLEAALAQAPTRRDVADWTWDNFQRVARAALAAAGGGPDGQ